jgi:predicted GNAT family N-acyltransferase
MKYNIKITHWDKDKQSLSDVRRKVFIEEQNVPEELEWDEFDKDCVHILVTDNNIPVACGRMKSDGQIGRMAVLQPYRNFGIGTEILKACLVYAKNHNINNIYLHAQTSAIGFYEKQGFEASSEEFMDANIPHKTMKKTIP